MNRCGKRKGRSLVDSSCPCGGVVRVHFLHSTERRGGSLVELARTRKSMAALKRTHLPPHFWLAISGRTKLNRDSGATFKIPCVAVTKGTGVEAGKWLARHLRCVIRSGRTQGYLFSTREGSRSYLSDFEDDFFWPLEELQERGNPLLPMDLDIREEYGIWRSLRRGVTAHAINRGSGQQTHSSHQPMENRPQQPRKRGTNHRCLR